MIYRLIVEQSIFLDLYVLSLSRKYFYSAPLVICYENAFDFFTLHFELNCSITCNDLPTPLVARYSHMRLYHRDLTSEPRRVNTHKNSYENHENDFLLLFQIQFVYLQYIHVYNIARAYKYSIIKYNHIIMYEIF